MTEISSIPIAISIFAADAATIAVLDSIAKQAHVLSSRVQPPPIATEYPSIPIAIQLIARDATDLVNKRLSVYPVHAVLIHYRHHLH